MSKLFIKPKFRDYTDCIVRVYYYHKVKKNFLPNRMMSSIRWTQTFKCHATVTSNSIDRIKFVSTAEVTELYTYLIIRQLESAPETKSCCCRATVVLQSSQLSSTEAKHLKRASAFAGGTLF